MKNNLLLFSLMFLFSCKGLPGDSYNREDGVFDLATANFQEKIPDLYTDQILNRTEIDYTLDSLPMAQLPDSVFSYKISNLLTESLGLKLPTKDFGYVYKSRELDSLIKFDHLYFNKFYTLTDNNKKPVAFYATSRYDQESANKAALNSFKEKFGPPNYAFFLDHGFNVCAYEWILKDRTIQVETSFGVEAVFGGGSSTRNSKYYQLDLLMIDNQQKDNIYKAHTLVLPDKLKYDGKWHSYKDLQPEKTMKVRDEFLLYSTNEAYVKDTTGLYNISRAETQQ